MSCEALDVQKQVEEKGQHACGRWFVEVKKNKDRIVRRRIFSILFMLKGKERKNEKAGKESEHPGSRLYKGLVL